MTAIAPDLENLSRLVNRFETVSTLRLAVVNAPQDISILRSSLARTLRDGAWQQWYDPHAKEMVEYPPTPDGLRAFITTKEPRHKGLGTTVDEIRRLLGSPDECPERVTLELALKDGPGGNNNPAGTNQHTPKGPEGGEVNVGNTNIDQAEEQPPRQRAGMNDVGYAVRRLSRERPDLLGRVTRGEISTNAAMIEAGFRKKQTPLQLLFAAWKKASKEERDAFVTEIGKEGW